MESENIFFIVITAILGILLIIFLIRRNWQDIKKIKPGASDATEEIRTDQERNRDKI